MSNLPINLPKRITTGQVITADWANSIREAIARLANRKCPQKKGGSGGTAGRCIFGETVLVPDTDPQEYAFRGGIIHCGPNNWFVPDEPIDTSSDLDTLIWIAVDCTVNTDDDGEILLPGVETGTEPTSWSSGASYPDNSAPTASSPAATVILPIGRLIVADGIPRLVPAGCGNFTVTHCAGTVGYTRQ
jgi:hypothetical protein